MKSKVYVLQEGGLDYTDAERYGELVFVSVDRRDDFHNVKNSEHNARLLSHIRSKLRSYDPEHDYIVATGGSPYVGIATGVLLGRLGFPTIDLLRWDNRDRVYRPLTLDFNKEMKDD